MQRTSQGDAVETDQRGILPYPLARQENKALGLDKTKQKISKNWGF
jgi:hypothetical protein